MKDLFLPLVFVFSTLTVYGLCSLVPPLLKVAVHSLDVRQESSRCKPVGQNGYRCNDGRTYWR